MAVLIDVKTKLIVQGITGHQGQFNTRAMLDYGTNVVAGVTPGKAGERVHGVPVFDSCFEGVDETGANASIMFVPAPFAKDAAIEAIEAGVRLLVIITEQIPFHDCLDVITYAQAKGCRVIGPNSPGIISPGKSKAGIMPNHIFRPGDVGVISRSGTLTYEVVNAITDAGFGESTCLGVGGDPVIGTTMPEALELLAKDRETKRIVLVGEIGGTTEEETAQRAKRMRKPIYAYIAGRTAPPGRRMGHAGAIISRGMGTAESKVRAFRDAGVPVVEHPVEIAALLTATAS
ncbi:MAG TPA: succinate--CoA ligase subunit alpha [Thermoplasmata archaeon]|nr:succinate--CoA ligase subunit alpha [Thermoplasmata archaeon]